MEQLLATRQQECQRLEQENEQLHLQLTKRDEQKASRPDPSLEQQSRTVGRDEVEKMEDGVLKVLLELILEEQARRRLCVVCLDSDSKILFLPCKHQKVCAACAATITSCPYCQQTVTDKICPF